MTPQIAIHSNGLLKLNEIQYLRNKTFSGLWERELQPHCYFCLLHDHFTKSPYGD